jgi:hypothetical protein
MNCTGEVVRFSYRDRLRAAALVWLPRPVPIPVEYHITLWSPASEMAMATLTLRSGARDETRPSGPLRFFAQLLLWIN